MTEHTKSIIKRVYKIFLTALTALLGVLFIVQIWSIFRSSETDPYTVEIVSKKFGQIAPFVWVWVISVVVGGVFWTVFPDETEKPKAYVATQTALKRLYARFPQGENLEEVKIEKKIRLVAYVVCLGLCIASAVVCLVYLLDSSFTVKFNAEIFHAHDGVAARLASGLPWGIVAFLSAVSAELYADKSRKTEIEIVKAEWAKSLKNGETKGAGTQTTEKKGWKEKLFEKVPFLKTEKFVAVCRIAVAAVGVGFVILGICNGGMADLLEKAVAICTQCIGLG